MTRQAQEVIFNMKLNKLVQLNLTFNNSQVSQTESQKHLGLTLDKKLNCSEQSKGVLDKISKTIGFIRKFQPIFPIFSLLSNYKTLVRLHSDYGDNIYDQAYNPHFTENLNLFDI